MIVYITTLQNKMLCLGVRLFWLQLRQAMSPEEYVDLAGVRGKHASAEPGTNGTCECYSIPTLFQ